MSNEPMTTDPIEARLRANVESVMLSTCDEYNHDIQREPLRPCATCEAALTLLLRYTEAKARVEALSAMCHFTNNGARGANGCVRFSTDQDYWCHSCKDFVRAEADLAAIIKEIDDA